MKLKNLSTEEQKVYPHTGTPFVVEPGQVSPELHPHVGADLVASFPSVWKAVPVNPTKKPSKES